MLFVVRPQKVRLEVDLPVWGHPQEPIILRLHPHPEKQANNNSTKLWVRSRDGSGPFFWPRIWVSDYLIYTL